MDPRSVPVTMQYADVYSRKELIALNRLCAVKRSEDAVKRNSRCSQARPRFL